MKKFYVLLSFLMIGILNAQVGINTEDPKATLDIQGEPTTVTTMDGLIAPRIEGDQLQAKTYTANQQGAIIYVTSGVSTQDMSKPQTFSVTDEGYYYFDGNQWIGLQRVHKMTKAQVNEIDHSYIAEGDVAYIYEITEPSNPIQEVSNVNAKGYYYFDGNNWINQSSDSSNSSSIYSASKDGGWSLITLEISNEYAPIDLNTLTPKFGNDNVNSVGYYVAPSSGYYQVNYELQTQSGIDISLLGNKRLWLVKNPTQPNESIEERKLFDAVRVAFEVLTIPINLATVPVTSTNLTTLVHLNQGETLAFATDKTLLQVGLLTSSKVVVNINKVAD